MSRAATGTALRSPGTRCRGLTELHARGGRRGATAIVRAGAGVAGLAAIGWLGIGMATACVGDCDGNGAVTIPELVRCVEGALEPASLARCRACDEDGDGMVAVAEVVRAVATALGGCPPAAPSPTAAPTATPPADAGFGPPEPMSITGYDGDAMEPFVTPDGEYLLFNDRNDPATDTNLFYAARVDDRTFAFRGELRGANSAALDAVPSMDRDGLLYFVSTRSYATTLSTLYRGRFVDGAVADVELVEGVSRQSVGWVNFDAGISPDGSTLYLVDGRFDGGGVPREADIVMASRTGTGFRRVASSSEILRAVNTDALEYAPAVSADGMELFFTRLLRADGRPRIMRAVRTRSDQAFAPPQYVPSIEGFAEAPALSPDGLALYYHALEAGRFVIRRTERARRP